MPNSAAAEKITFGSVSRADLLRTLILAGDDCLETVAELSGFKAPEPARLALKLPDLPKELLQESTSPAPPPEPVPTVDTEVPIYFYRVVERKVSDLLPQPKPEGSPPTDWYEGIPALDLGSVKAADIEPPAKLPIVPWNKLWPVLHRLLSELRRSKHPDLPRLTEMLAHAEMPQRIPRRSKQSWIAEVRLLVDRPQRTSLFNGDYNKLLEQLQRFRGTTGLEVQQILKNPGDSVRIRRHETYFCRPWRMPEAGAAIVILSDLGLLERTGSALQAWLRFGKRLRNAGFNPIVLLPLPQRYLKRELVTLFRCICW
ncbi:MAG: hypothetical protein ACU84J_12975, partial [Gammaproteobacteria bacterium]